ncbi:helix-turn-helix domain-containing protein [Zhenhengia yiwuensis]|uniref:Helix-turn-helix transcriptional regulator n=1 Tax=Zhenhengia yiwuensis TaxID=2763666 RepID=A0A926EHY1_9FIRM|nr:helix-turn-helix transcriptional regulator [Zhenhengia yiwuensis]MBC8579961.1 helix-turn-helix transcriptional regulator [Zhenhengia yiwuensis]
MTTSVNKLIKKRRLELGLTLKDVANALNVAESTVSRYESKDIQNMGIDKIKELANVLQCSPGFLMGWEDSVTIKATNNSLSLSQNEKELVKKYRVLDEKGQHTVNTVLDMEHNRCTNDYLIPIAAHNDNITNEELELINQDLADMDNW